jgi:hypothetical protein
MKKQLILGLALVASVFSCTTDDTSDIVINDNSVINNNGNGTGNSNENVTIQGNYFTDLTLDPTKNYTIGGPLVMTAGTTLTIPECMTIRANAGGAQVYIAIAQGAQIIANGSSTCPIVFTSNAAVPAAGDWGGLILLGRAPINSATGSGTATSEIGNLPYGGTNAADNSGSLSYVRVEYSGGAASSASENNAFSFYGVGNGTNVDHIQAFEGKDDGIEFFGGTVNASFVSSVNSQDDSVDWTEGFSGTLTDVYIKNRASDDKAIEGDGLNNDVGNLGGFLSNPTFVNVSIVGEGSANSPEAVRLRVGTKGSFTNMMITGYGEGFDLDDAQTGVNVLNDELQVTDVTFTDVLVKLKNDTGSVFTDADFYTGDGNGTGTNYATWGAGWTVQ